MKIAVVGSGISGMLLARLLHAAHDVTLFEADDRTGGHTHTHAIESDGRTWHVDTGFIVCNDWTYPNFLRMLAALGVETQQSDMSFSVRNVRTGLEYNGATLDTLFAQRSNFLRPSFLAMVRDILRFHREAPRLLETEDEGPTLGRYLDEQRYGRGFVENYLLPMGGAVWSADTRSMREFPARYLVQFFQNHGMLSVDERPTWRTVRGGSRRYVEALLSPLHERVRISAGVRSVRRFADHVEVSLADGSAHSFDQVAIATHSDQALTMLSDATDAEREVLGAIPYQENDAVLHTDACVMPRRTKVWASWNYHLGTSCNDRAAVTYWMNRLQALDAPRDFFVTLNDTSAIDPSKVLRRIRYHHPVYRREGVAAQRRWSAINGVRRTWFCGAYWGFGFHEDGVKSALAVAERFGIGLDALERQPRATEVAAS